jgi:hypothetical protein
MAVVARRNTISSLGSQDLINLALAVCPAFFRISGLQEAAPTAAAVVVGAVGIHFHEIFCAHNGFNDITQVFGNGIAKGFAYQLAGILNRKLDLAFLVPLGVNLEFALADPLGI